MNGFRDREPLGAPNKSRGAWGLLRFFKPAQRHTEPTTGTFGLQCPGCTAAQIAGYWQKAAQQHPQDALYAGLSARWTGIEVAHAGHNYTKAKAGKEVQK